MTSREEQADYNADPEISIREKPEWIDRYFVFTMTSPRVTRTVTTGPPP